MKKYDMATIDEVMQLNQLLEDFQAKSRKSVNSFEAIDAFHDWYSKASVCFVEQFGNNDMDVIEFRSVDNSGNGYVLLNNYYQISSCYQILLSRLNTNHMRIKSNEDKSKPMKVFVSHSSKDRYFVEALVQLLEFIGLDDKTLFCSSVQGYGIGFNKDIFNTLREQFEKHDLYVIFVHSPHFYDSHASLNEMGAAWVLKTDFCSFLVKGFDYADMDGAIRPNERVSIKVDNDDAKSLMNDFKDQICQKFGLKCKNGIVWEVRRDEFLKVVLNQPAM